MTKDAEILSFGIDYASICLIGSVGIFMQFCFERLLLSTGKTTLAMLTQLIGAITNIILDPILIFGLGPVPSLGVAGAAYATIAGQILAAIVAIIMNKKCNREITIKLRSIKCASAFSRSTMTTITTSRSIMLLQRRYAGTSEIV